VVEITFTQEVQRISGTFGIEVVRDRGQSVTAGPAEVNADDRTTISVPLEPDLSPGRYVVRWTNVSDVDGDPAEGAFSFYLNAEPNTVDLQNDEQLEQIGAEDETPVADETLEADATSPATAGPSQPESSPTLQPIGGPEGDVIEDDDGVTALVVIVIVAVVAVALAGIGWFWLRSRQRVE
jgi:hypothetical protein